MDEMEANLAETMRKIDPKGELRVTTITSTRETRRDYRWLTVTGSAVIIRGLTKLGLREAIGVGQPVSPDGWWLKIDERTIGSVLERETEHEGH